MDGDGVQEFLNNVLSVVMSRKSPNVLCIVHSEAGLEVLFNTQDLVIKVGMIDVAKMTIVEQQARFNEEHEEEIRQNAVKASAAVGKNPGGVN